MFVGTIGRSLGNISVFISFLIYADDVVNPEVLEEDEEINEDLTWVRFLTIVIQISLLSLALILSSYLNKLLQESVSHKYQTLRKQRESELELKKKLSQ